MNTVAASDHLRRSTMIVSKLYSPAKKQRIQAISLMTLLSVQNTAAIVSIRATSRTIHPMMENDCTAANQPKIKKKDNGFNELMEGDGVTWNNPSWVSTVWYHKACKTAILSK